YGISDAVYDREQPALIVIGEIRRSAGRIRLGLPPAKTIVRSEKDIRIRKIYARNSSRVIKAIVCLLDRGIDDLPDAITPIEHFFSSQRVPAHRLHDLRRARERIDARQVVKMSD